jgi:hypothetical protein
MMSAAQTMLHEERNLSTVLAKSRCQIESNGAEAKGGGAEPFPLEVLKDLLGHDRDHANLPLLVIFVKAFSWDILGVKEAGSEGRKTVEEDGPTKITNGATEEMMILLKNQGPVVNSQTIASCIARTPGAIPQYLEAVLRRRQGPYHT